MWWLIGFGWLVCGVLDYGLTFAHFQLEYPTLAERDYWKDVRRSFAGFLLGPIGILSTLACGFYDHGFKWR